MITEEAEDRTYKWEIKPHPYDSQFDTMVTDSDKEARGAILYAGEMWLWDDNDGGKRTLTVTHNAEVPGTDDAGGDAQ